MIDLFITHLTHPWGPPWTLETLGDPWRPLATCLKMAKIIYYLLITCVGAKEFLTVLAATLNTHSDLLMAAGTAKTTFARYERRGNCS